jgi:hypothetical protein
MKRADVKELSRLSRVVVGGRRTFALFAAFCSFAIG